MWILYVAIYLIGCYVAMRLCTKQEVENCKRLEKYGNEAIRMYYENKHYIASPESTKLLVGSAIAIIIVIIMLWPIVFSITAVWNYIDFRITEKKFKKD